MKIADIIREFVRKHINTRIAYMQRSISDNSMLRDQMYIAEDNDSDRDVIIKMIESDNLWEINNYEKFIASYMTSKRTGYLSKYTPNDFKESKVTTFKLMGYNIGFALKPIPETNDVDIISVHNCTDVHNIGDYLIEAAIRHGGNILDHFDGFLSTFYEKHGFVEYARAKWNDEYAPDDWNYEKDGRPDVIMRRLKK